jgi:SAM-dependent methyltransferase
MSDPSLRDAFDADKSARRYDEVPYQSYPVPSLDPARLGAVAALWGHRAQKPETARILEIGCATAGHSIGLAARYPQAQVHGLDVSKVQIDAGRGRAARLGLTNLILTDQSVTELTAADGPFDYIICHGVFSWVSDEIRAAILKSCKTLLAPNGIAAISFNVLPGWHLLQVIRSTAMLHARRFEESAEKAFEMRALFEGLSRMTLESSSYGSVWRNELARIAPMPDFYLLHEMLEDHNKPMTFTDFNDLVEKHGLHYLADANFYAGIPENAGIERGAFIRGLAGDKRVLTEQYADVVTGRTFRSAIVVGLPLPEKVTDANLELLEELHLTIGSGIELRPDEENTPILHYFNNGTLEIGFPVVAHALQRMLDRRPATSTVEEILQPEATTEERDLVVRSLTKLLCMGVIDATLSPVDCGRWPQKDPKAWPLALSDARAGEDFTCSLAQTSVRLSDRSRFLLGLADGSKPVSEINEALLAVISGGGASITEHGKPVTDLVRLRKIVSNAVEEEFQNFAGAGLLMP